jgi:hypothetical protein
MPGCGIFRPYPHKVDFVDFFVSRLSGSAKHTAMNCRVIVQCSAKKSIISAPRPRKKGEQLQRPFTPG